MTELELLKEEKEKIMEEVSLVHDKYMELNNQLETMQNLFTDYQVCCVWLWEWLALEREWGDCMNKAAECMTSV